METLMSEEDRLNFGFASSPIAAWNRVLNSEAFKNNKNVPEDLLEMCQGQAPDGDSYLICLGSVVFADNNYKKAIGFLNDYISQNLVEIPGVWGPHLATHALKLIEEQNGLSRHYEYNHDARLDALRRVRK